MDRVVVRGLDAAVNGAFIWFECFGMEDMVDTVEEFVAVVTESRSIAASSVGIGQCFR